MRHDEEGDSRAEREELNSDVALRAAEKDDVSGPGPHRFRKKKKWEMEREGTGSMKRRREETHCEGSEDEGFVKSYSGYILPHHVPHTSLLQRGKRHLILTSDSHLTYAGSVVCCIGGGGA